MCFYLRPQPEGETPPAELLEGPGTERGYGRAAREGDSHGSAKLQGPSRLGGQSHEDKGIVFRLFDHQPVVADFLQQACIAADPALAKLFAGTVDGRAALVVSNGQLPADLDAAIAHGCAASRSHGGFDNDPATMNSVLVRILDGAPRRKFTARDLNY